MMAAIRSLFLMIFTFTSALNELAEAISSLCRTARKQASVFEREQDLENEHKLKQLEMDLAALPARLATIKAKPVKAVVAP